MNRTIERAARAAISAAVAAVAVALAVAAPAHAHGGGLDKHGCHHDRKRGGYHCHRAPAAAAGLDWTPPRRAATAAPSAYRPTPAGAASRLRPSAGTYYPNCSAARAAGAAPVLLGEPGYSRRLDRDGDGRACE